MSTVKKTISIDRKLFRASEAVSHNFSHLVAQALRHYLQQLRIEEAKQSFGAWQKREQDSVAFVNKLREEKGRDYAKRSD